MELHRVELQCFAARTARFCGRNFPNFQTLCAGISRIARFCDRNDQNFQICVLEFPDFVAGISRISTFRDRSVQNCQIFVAGISRFLVPYGSPQFTPMPTFSCIATRNGSETIGVPLCATPSRLVTFLGVPKTVDPGSYLDQNVPKKCPFLHKSDLKTPY